MSCCCGHGLCHHHEYGYPAAYGPPPGAYFGPAEPYGYGLGRRRRRRVDAEELADYLEDLEAEVARVRGELEELRQRATTESR